MRIVQPRRLAVFDLDGVLVDSRANMHSAWGEVLRRMRWDVPFERYFERIGRPFRDILQGLGLCEGLAEAEATYAAASIARFDLIRTYPGIPEALIRLRDSGVLLGIVTSKDATRTAMCVDVVGVGFDVVQPPAPGLNGKPAPDQLLAAAAAPGVPMRDCVYVGDMPVDALCARNAGAAYAHAGWGYGAAPADARLVLSDPSDLSATLFREALEAGAGQ